MRGCRSFTTNPAETGGECCILLIDADWKASTSPSKSCLHHSPSLLRIFLKARPKCHGATSPERQVLGWRKTCAGRTSIKRQVLRLAQDMCRPNVQWKTGIDAGTTNCAGTTSTERRLLIWHAIWPELRMPTWQARTLSTVRRSRTR